MSFLTYPKLAAFGECLMSFWFRAPIDTLKAAGTAAPVGVDSFYPEFSDVAPLVVFGDPPIRQDFVIKTPTVATGPNIGFDGSGLFTILAGHWELRGQTISLENKHYLDPAYIGVDSGGNLVVNLQTNQFPRVTNYSFTPDQPQETDQLPVPDLGWPNSLTIRHFAPSAYIDKSVESLMRGIPESYQLSASLKPDRDQWHHALLSFKLGDSVNVKSTIGFGDVTFNTAVQSYSKVWLVVDDVPIKIKDNTLTLSGQPDDGAIISQAQWQMANTIYDAGGPHDLSYVKLGFDRPIDPISGIPFGFSDMQIENFSAPNSQPTYELSSPVISAGTLGIPASTRFAKSVCRVEMAEFQMWIGPGSSRDVRTRDMRRLFITDEGKPNLQSKEVSDVLGEASIILHKSGRWITGKNTGTLKTPFVPTGKIKSYKPDPSLHGPQSPPL